MKGVWGRLVLVFFVLVGAVAIASGGSASQRVVEADFKVFPGPAKVTYDELIAYRATFLTKSTASLQKVRFVQTIPVAEGQDAVLETHTCPTTPTTVVIADGPDEWVCTFGTVPSGTPKLVVTSVWKVPNLGDTTICTDCLAAKGAWFLNEGTNDVSNPNDRFGYAELFATLLPSGAIPETNGETLLAGGYEIGVATSCGEGGNLKTHGVIGIANPIVTKYCLPARAFGPAFIPVGSGDPGYATTITETLGNPRHTEVCIAKLGTDCVPGYQDQNFFTPDVLDDDDKVTVVIEVSDAALQTPAKGRETVESVSHNGVPMTAATCATAGDCIVSIILDNKTKVWTIIVTAGSNGFFDID
jgi:hypothetical protein